jgi:hypothetical protein
MTQQLEPTRHPSAPGNDGASGPPVPLPSFARHEVASGTSAPGRAPGVVLAVVAVLVMGIVSGLVAAVLAGTLRLPTTPAPAAPPAPTSADPAALAVTGRSQLLVAYGELSSAGRTFSDQLAAHGGDTRAQQRDCAVHREAARRFRAAVADLAFASGDRARVDAELLPAADRMLADLDTMVATPSLSRLVQTAGDFDRHGAELDGVVRSIIGG